VVYCILQLVRGVTQNTETNTIVCFAILNRYGHTCTKLILIEPVSVFIQMVVICKRLIKKNTILLTLNSQYKPPMHRDTSFSVGKYILN